ncbi:MAG: hypothetical protein ACYS21_17210, partial [Planctomycetota bacterium]
MKRVITYSLVLWMLCSVPAFGAGDEPVAWWKFDDIEVERVTVEMVRGETFVPREVLSYVTESVSGNKSDLFGKYYEVVPGVSGDAVMLDGYTAYVEVGPEQNEEGETYYPNPEVSGDFTVEAWIALGAYPKHWCPIVDNQRDMSEGYFNGYFFGVDALGRIMFR